MKNATAFTYITIVFSIQDVYTIYEWKIKIGNITLIRFFYDTIIIKHSFLPYTILYNIESRNIFFSFNRKIIRL